MQITLKVFATLRNYLKSGEATYIHEGPLSVRELIRAYDIPEAEATIILVNGIHCALEKDLVDGDTVSVFPPVGGG